ncbi:hypothetical protein F2Q70_00045439 [Brassica cretica]|uniref:Uncharacterized protein n=1 Tax=Brassica cretica TaxID=69181 RepID=A0A8S9KJJ1_BRACR|nr:hypothetical protein F2Q70_00045439 [Brassica cretica]
MLTVSSRQKWTLLMKRIEYNKLPEDFFARDSSAANGADDVTKCSSGQFEDGEFDIEDFVALVGGVGRNRRLDQGLGFWSIVMVLRFVGVLLDVFEACEVACSGALTKLGRYVATRHVHGSVTT